MASTIRALLAAAGAASLLFVFALPGCGSDSGGGAPHFGGNGGGGTGGSTDGGGGTSGSGATGTGLCLLNNCHSDAECDGCTFGRTKCDVPNTRCIACTQDSECKAGEKCSSFGTCAPKDLTCPTDGQGTPTITCKADSDCAACDPLHQICDQSKCVACKAGNSSSCTGNQTCGGSGGSGGNSGACVDKCPASCSQDSDCSNCANGGVEAKACFNHTCSECSTSKPCAPGFECDKGKCIKPCGAVGGAGADCTQDAECYGCGNSVGSTDAGSQNWTCKFPVNGGSHGSCTVPAQGCTDLLSAGAVLPPPFDQVTNACSTDANCSGVSMDVNVGKLIRDLIGADEINLGITKIKIQDAILKYNMKACASINLINDKKCGVCVPCNDDKDCDPINLDSLTSDLFKGDPLIQVAVAYLMDKLFGKGQKHELHMQCQQVAAGYGICAPCSNPLSACGAESGTPTSGNCGHDTCTTGDALDPTCGVCQAAVCAADIFCCTVAWDEQCKLDVDQYCGQACPGDPSCTAHTPCETGAAMKDNCSTCTLAVCDADPTCCDQTNGTWDQSCVDLVLNDNNVRPQCGGACPGTSSCSHSECTEGTFLTSGCSECATIVCQNDPYCCNSTSGKWDLICADEASKQPKCPACPKQ